MGAQFPKSAPARFGCKQRSACNNIGAGYGGAVPTRSGGMPVRTVRAELACLSLSAARSGALLRWCSDRWRNQPFRRVTLYAVYCSANAAWGVYNDVIILTRCQSVIISDIRPFALKFPMAHGTACRSRALQLKSNMTVQYL